LNKAKLPLKYAAVFVFLDGGMFKRTTIWGGDLRKQTSLMKLRKLLGEGPRMIPHSALSDDIAGEEVQLMNERLM